jgi:hypothetical protein
MSETAPRDNAAKTPERQKAEDTIARRLQGSTRFQRAGSALGLLLGVTAGLTYNTEAPGAIPFATILATIPVMAKRHHAWYHAYLDCDTAVYNYQRAVTPPVTASYNAVKRVKPCAIGDTGLYPPLRTLAEGFASYVATAVLTTPESLPTSTRLASGIAFGALALTATIISDIERPSKDIRQYSAQLDNVDFNNGVAPLPPIEPTANQ